MEQKEGEALELECLIRRKRIPILTLDERWHRMFPEEQKTDEIRALEAEVNNWLKKQGKTNTDLDDMRKAKSILMKNIVNNMEEARDSDSEKERGKRLSKSQQLIREANEKIDELEVLQLQIPSKLQEANEQLMKASIGDCYERFYQNKSEIEEIAKWISEIRIELKKKLIMKQEMEEANELIYSNMHDMLGPDVMEYLDHIYGEK